MKRYKYSEMNISPGLKIINFLIEILKDLESALKNEDIINVNKELSHFQASFEELERQIRILNRVK